MSKFAAIIATAMAVAPGAGPAGAQSPQGDFCNDLIRLVEVARAGADFHAFERKAATPPRLGFDKCFVASAARPTWHCHQTMAPESRRYRALGARIAACLPGAKRQATRLQEAVFTLRGVRIRVRESGGPLAHVGRIVSFDLEAVKP